MRVYIYIFIYLFVYFRLILVTAGYVDGAPQSQFTQVLEL